MFLKVLGWPVQRPKIDAYAVGEEFGTFYKNDSVNHVDLNGLFGIATATGAIVGAIAGGISAVIQGNTSIREIAAGVSGGAVSGAIAGLAVDLSVYTGGAATVFLIAAGGALGGASGSITESKINGDSIQVTNVLCDAAIGLGSSFIGLGAGKVVDNIVASKATNMILNPAKAVGTDVILTISQKTGEIVVELGKTIDKVIVAGTSQVINAEIALAADIAQDILNPTENLIDNGEQYENSDSRESNNKNH